jgi:hypothetical protein
MGGNLAGLRAPSGGQKPSPRGGGNASAWSAYATLTCSRVVTLCCAVLCWLPVISIRRGFNASGNQRELIVSAVRRLWWPAAAILRLRQGSLSLGAKRKQAGSLAAPRSPR